MKDGVYFARRTFSPLIKIGWSARPEGRARDSFGAEALAIYYPDVCLASTAESRFHAEFEPDHVGGEWFNSSAKLHDVIDQINAGTFLIDVLPQPGWAVTKPYQCKASIAHYGKLARYGDRKFRRYTHTAPLTRTLSQERH